jgi:hypothetical protein
MANRAKNLDLIKKSTRIFGNPWNGGKTLLDPVARVGWNRGISGLEYAYVTAGCYYQQY